MMWSHAPVVTQASKRGQQRPPPEPAQPDWQPPTDLPSFKQRSRIALDCETHDPDLEAKGPGVRRDGFITGIALGLGPTEAGYYPIAHDKGPNLDREQTLSWLKEEGANFTGEIVGANLSYDLDFLAENNVHFPKAQIRDVQTAERLLDENQLGYKLGQLGQRRFDEGKATDELEQLYGKGYIKAMKGLWPGHVAPYAEGDVTLPWRIYEEQEKELSEQGLEEVHDIECRLAPLLLQMRRNGVRVDIERAKQAEVNLKSRLVTARDALPRPTDIWSADSVAKLFDDAGVKYPLTEATKAPSFRRPWLEACPHPIAQQVVAVRGIDKILNPFLSNYILEGGASGRIHGTFNQLGARTGRMSSSDPNLQNIPVRDPELGPLLRSMFIPEDGYDWGCADWSQIEFRLLVHYAIKAGFKSALQAATMYREDPTTDFHQMAAGFTSTERGLAKNINFGVVYGMGVALMAAILGVSYSEGESILKMFHTELPFLKEIYDAASGRARQRKYIKTILGRRRRFPGGQFTHKALNALLQGSAADLMKKAMVEMWDAGIFATGMLIPHLTVHDEMDVSIPKTKAGREAWGELIHIMETSLTLEVPVTASANVGGNWDLAK